MSKNFYDKECKHPIEAFYDPCYRTGDFYRISYINNNLPTGSPEFTDLLYSIIKRSDGKIIYFIDSLGNELKLKPIKFEKYLESSKYLFWFKTEDSHYIVYDEQGILLDKYDNLESINGIFYNHSDDLDLGVQLVSYSFSPNYKEKDNIINPLNYRDVEPMTEEEEEIVRIRSTTNPLYKPEYGVDSE